MGRNAYLTDSIVEITCGLCIPCMPSIAVILRRISPAVSSLFSKYGWTLRSTFSNLKSPKLYSFKSSEASNSDAYTTSNSDALSPSDSEGSKPLEWVKEEEKELPPLPPVAVGGIRLTTEWQVYWEKHRSQESLNLHDKSWFV